MYSSVANLLQKKFNFDAHYFLKGGFWLSLTQIITIICGLLTSVLFAHYLNPNDFGIYRYLIGLSALLAAFSLTGLGQSILQTSAKKYYGFYLETIKTNLIYSAGIFLVGISGFFYYLIKDNFLLAIGCLLIAILQPIISSFGNTPSFLQGQQRYRESTILQVIKTGFISLTSVSVIFQTHSIIILFVTFLLSSAVVNFLGHLWFKPVKTASTPQEIFESYKSYAIHTSLRNLIASVANRADTIVVFTQLGAVDLAIYTIATVIPEQIKSSFKNLANLLLPKYAHHTDNESLKKSIPKRSLQLFVLLLIITIIYITISPFLYKLLFPKYSEAIFLSQISALAFPSFVLFIPYSIIQSRLAEKALYSLQIVTSGLQIILTVSLTLMFGIVGAIIARIIYRYIFMLSAYYQVNKL